MSSIEDSIRLHNSIAEQFNKTHAIASMVNDSSWAAYRSAVSELKQSICLQPAFAELQETLHSINRTHEAAFQGLTTFNQMMKPVMQEYQAMAGVTNFVRQVQASVKPIVSCLQGIQPMLQESSVFAQLAEIHKQVSWNPAMLTGLQQALEAQINSSVWEYEAEQEEVTDFIDEEMQEDIIALTEATDKPSAVKQFLTKWGEKGKHLLVEFIKWLIGTLASCLIAYYCEPVFKVLLPSVCLLEEDAETANRVEIPVNTEVHVWNEVTNNFIEITYTVGGEEQQGYITQEELNSNTELISIAVSLEHIVFINNVTQVLSERWKIMPEQVYSFLKDDTDLVNGYLLKHYDVLSVLDVDDFVNAFEAYCENEGIEIPKVEE